MYLQWIYNCIHVYVNRINGIDTEKKYEYITCHGAKSSGQMGVVHF